MDGKQKKKQGRWMQSRGGSKPDFRGWATVGNAMGSTNTGHVIPEHGALRLIAGAVGRDGP